MMIFSPRFGILRVKEINGTVRKTCMMSPFVSRFIVPISCLIEFVDPADLKNFNVGYIAILNLDMRFKLEGVYDDFIPIENLLKNKYGPHTNLLKNVSDITVVSWNF